MPYGVLKNQKEITAAFGRERGAMCRRVFDAEGEPIKDFRGAWKAACRATGVPGPIPHYFRRRAVRSPEQVGQSSVAIIVIALNVSI